MRQHHPGAPKMTAKLIAASVMDSAVSNGRDRLGALIRAGETAQAMRAGDTLRQVGEAIRTLSLDGGTGAIGSYYLGLSLCRRGSDHYQEANELFSSVTSRAPALFLAKAHVALGVNLTIAGDIPSARLIHDEVSRITKYCGSEALPSLFLVALNRSHIQATDGDHQGALRTLWRIGHAAKSIGIEYSPFVNVFKNNLAWELVRNGRLEEAIPIAEELRASRFIDLYPEWLKTSNDILALARKPERCLVTIGERFTGHEAERESAVPAPSPDTVRARPQPGVPEHNPATDHARPESEPGIAPRDIVRRSAARFSQSSIICTESAPLITILRRIQNSWCYVRHRFILGPDYAKSPLPRAPPLLQLQTLTNSSSV